MRGKIDPKVNFTLLLSLFNKLFVVHWQLLLILLEAHVDTVHKHFTMSYSRFWLNLYLGVPLLQAFLARGLCYLLAWGKVYKVEKAWLWKIFFTLWGITLRILVLSRCWRLEQVWQGDGWGLVFLRLRCLRGRSCLLTWLVLRAMDELASLTVWAIASLSIFFAFLGFVLSWHVRLYHHLLSTMGKRTL